MHGRGHVGAALCAYAPIGAALGAVGETSLATAGMALAVAVSSLPDADEYLPIAHRGVTHTVWFGLVLTAVAAAAGASVGTRLGRPVDVAAIAGASVAVSFASHLLADSVTPMGIRPLYPLTAWHHSFDVTLSANSRANTTLLGAGILATVLWHVAVLV